MVVQHRHGLLLLIYTLCYAVVIHSILLDTNDAEICNLLCEQCNSSAIFSNDYCECNFSDDNNRDTECIQRLQREIRTIDLNVLSDDLTDEERSVRSILKSRRRLRMGDANKVAQYFINGGPSAGHSYFIRAYNVTYNSADSTSSSFSEAARQENPVMSDTRERSSILGTVNSILNHPNEYDLTSPLLGTVAHPYREYDNRSPLHHTLLRTATLPTQFLHNLFAYRSSNRYPTYQDGIVTNTNPLQDGLANIPFADKWKNTAETIKSYDSSSARNNMNKPIVYNVASSISGSDWPIQSTQVIKTPYIFSTLPMQYRYFGLNSQYNPYYNPLINILHPLDGYILQPVSYLQSTSNQLISASSPTSNNANSEQRSDVTSDKTVNADDKTKELNNIITNIISKEKTSK